MAIDLSEWEEALNHAFEEGKTCMLVSANKDGQPDIAFKGSMMVWDRETGIEKVKVERLGATK